MRKSASFRSSFLIRGFGDRIVLRSVPTYIDELNVSVAISPLQFSTGEPHPLASQPKLEISLHDPSTFDLSMMDMTVIGDYALYWIADRVESSLRCIYLVAWKEGWISEVRLPTPTHFDDALK